jgi:hypothetical protein
LVQRHDFIRELPHLPESFLRKSSLLVGDEQAREEAGQGNRGSGERGPVSLGKLPRPVESIARTSLYRPAIKKSAEVTGKGIYREIAFLRLIAERSANDAVELARNRGVQAAGRSQLRFAVRGGASPGKGFARQLSGQQLVQNGAE